MLKMRMNQNPIGNYSSGGSGGGVRSWRMYSGHSDNDLPPQRQSSTRGQHYSKSGGGGSVMSRTGARSLSSSGGAEDVISKSLSPDRERVAAGGGGGSGGGGGGDSDDVESLVSFVSGTSALSTQSERPSASYMKRAG